MAASTTYIFQNLLFRFLLFQKGGQPIILGWSLKISNLLMEYQTKLNGKFYHQKKNEGSITFQIIKFH